MEKLSVGGYPFTAAISGFSACSEKHLICCQALCKEEDTPKLYQVKLLCKNFGNNASVHFRMNNCICILAFPLSVLACLISGLRLWNKWV